MSKTWATRWRLTCPDCGKVWAEVVGYGRWHAVGGWDPEVPCWPEGLHYSRGASVPEGPKEFPIRNGRWPDGRFGPIEDLTPDEARSVTKWRPCSEHGSLPAAALDLALTLTLTSQARELPPNDDGTKVCLACGRRFVVGRRSDSYCCSVRCRKAMSRRIARDRAVLRGTRWEVRSTRRRHDLP